MKRRGFFGALAAAIAAPFVATAKVDPIVQAVEALDAAPVPEASRMLWSAEGWTEGLARTFHDNQAMANAVNRAYLDNLWLASNPIIVVDPDKLGPIDWPILPGKVVHIDPAS